MATYVTDSASLAWFNAGLPPDEQADGYWQLDQHEQEKAVKQEAKAQSDIRLREWYQKRGRRNRY